MPEIAYQVIKTPFDASGAMLIKWPDLANGDTGQPFRCPHYTDKAVQISGTFGAGGNCRIQGAHDPDSPTWATLNDAQGNALDVGLAKIEQVLENVYQIQPNITAGDGTTALTVHLLVATSR